MNTTICDAIRDGEIIEFEYDGALRIVEPFIYGLNSQGIQVLYAYQMGGFNTEKSQRYDWETFEVDQIGTIKFIGKKFTVKRDGYEKREEDIKTLYCKF